MHCLAVASVIGTAPATVHTVPRSETLFASAAKSTWAKTKDALNKKIALAIARMKCCNSD